MNRRGFLQSILALSAAPAIVRADSLMRIVPRDLVLDVSGESFLSVPVGQSISIGDGLGGQVLTLMFQSETRLGGNILMSPDGNLFRPGDTTTLWHDNRGVWVEMSRSVSAASEALGPTPERL